ncbi:Subtilin transport ATP-binding protein SpaT [Bacillus wiedmannii]|uniref:Subtilin transport ATP-binding protein SpaT n=3 Tax=Bacillus wiedmannii TaxID=1890302 RepID=A0A1C4FCX7_9BACI|nr:Subtilin transport ATP-binding protein SpaT [Bacillus wiedmannii]SCL90314.1 Subtilin transport ATP-binding protein SpaT [Bacillus wiedmannii]
MSIAFFLGKIIWKSSPILVIVLLVLLSAEGLIVAIQLFATREILNGIKNANPSDTYVYIWGIVYCSTFVIGIFSVSITSWIQKLLGEKSMLTINTTLLEAIEKMPGMRFFEEIKYRDKLETLRDSTSWLPMQIVESTGSVITGGISLISIIIVVGTLSPLLAVILIVSAIPFVIYANKFTAMEWVYENEFASNRRKMSYYRDNLLMKNTVQEVRLFNLGEFFLKQYKETFDVVFSAYKKIQTKSLIPITLTGLLSGGVSGIGYLWVTYKISNASLTIGDIALYLTALFQLNVLLRNVSNEFVETLELWRMGGDFHDFVKLKPDVQISPNSKFVDLSEMNIEFKNVSFSYSTNKEHKILRNLSFRLNARQSTAIVGMNGEGKSTIVKLLCRFYDPDEGEILINNINIKEIEIQHLRKHISAIFQSFGKYGLAIDENIGIGDYESIENKKQIQEIAKRVGIHEKINSYSDSYKTMVGNEWNGIEFSGGQWQKIALARAFFRNASTLIMDEPTAALDIKSEEQLYNQFYLLTRQKTVLLISHRFSTVKMVDSIIVIKDGEVIEQGSHEALMDKQGEYAKMYLMQASSFSLEGTVKNEKSQ